VKGVSDSTILELIELIYEAALDPQRWTTFTERFATAVGAREVFFLVHDYQNNCGNIAMHVNVDPFFREAYDKHYASLNEWVKRGKRLFTPGRVVASQMAISDAELVKTEFYNDYLRAADMRHSLGGILSNDESTVSALGANRPPSRVEFGRHEIALLSTLMPHLQRAIQVHNRISRLEGNLRATSDALDAFPIGVLLLDDSGSVVLMNRKAERLVSRNEGLKVTPDGLSAAIGRENVLLRQMITRASYKTDRAPILSGGTMTISRPSLKRPLALLITPVVSNFAVLGSDRAAVVVFVSDPDDQVEPDARVVRQILGLTPTEARLAAAIMQGKSLEVVSEELNMSIKTARTHLKRIFSKTGTNRQAELVRLLLNSVASLRVSPDDES